MVVTHDPELSRTFWKTARITKLLINKGKDEQCRGAILKVAARGDQATVLQ